MLFMNANIGLHVHKTPANTFAFVGAVPNELGLEVAASKSDVMGGRAYRNAEKEIVVRRFPSFPSREDAVKFAESKGFTVEPDAK